MTSPGGCLWQWGWQEQRARAGPSPGHPEGREEWAQVPGEGGGQEGWGAACSLVRGDSRFCALSPQACCDWMVPRGHGEHTQHHPAPRARALGAPSADHGQQDETRGAHGVLRTFRKVPPWGTPPCPSSQEVPLWGTPSCPEEGAPWGTPPCPEEGTALRTGATFPSSPLYRGRLRPGA